MINFRSVIFEVSERSGRLKSPSFCSCLVRLGCIEGLVAVDAGVLTVFSSVC